MTIPPPTKSATNSGENPAKQLVSQAASTLKTYWIPLILFSLFFLFQLALLPNSFPPSHYDVLQISMGSSAEKVKEAYENFVSKWNSGTEVPTANDFIKIRYAYELLSNPLWKRDYDSFGIDEHQHILRNITLLNSEERYSAVNLSLLDVGYSETNKSGLSFLSSEDLRSIIQDDRSSLIQIYSDGSNLCKRFSSKWKKIVTLLGEVANTGVVELGEFELVSSLAEKKPTGQPFFRNGLPSLIAIPRGCRASNCLVRYEGELSVDGVTDWFATTILMLPRIPYYTKETLGPRFLAKSSYNKVKVLFFSDTGMRATPFVRQLAKKYRDYASLACVLWREEDHSYWWTNYDVEAAPATVFLRDPGTKPLVYYGSVNSSWFVNVMEDNKLHELPQLRSVTSKELGCDSRGYSRAGSSTNIWYCVILIGRPSSEMNQMRQGLRRVQQTLSEKNEQDVAGIGELASLKALEEKRLTFTWIDGEVQKNLCIFYIGGELGVESCGPRRSIEEIPRMVMVRYMRNDSMSDVNEKKVSNSILDILKEDVDPVSQLVARYDGSLETPSEIIEWISKIVKDGDSANLPFYRTKTPELVPDNSDPLWVGSEKFISTSGQLKHKLQSVILWFRDLQSDPKIGPLLLLGALMSFGGIWLRRSQPTHSTDSDQSQQTRDEKNEIPKEWRDRKRTKPTGVTPSSMTDVDPKDAYQMPLSDSDDE